ncbi:hypothetical protein [Thermoanaerobacterium sp. DL9XJH110]|jgi:hypothetical protein|uniref:hypothetical protein n=1 Tax=Thermoanaerobacterium sp. DL9XJH110 TaxID=3386643 RepID=UPI003BB65BD4
MSEHTELNSFFDKLKEELSEQKDPSLEGVESAINKMKHEGDKKIGIEFECGDCCKKVINGSHLFFLGNFAILLPEPGDCLFLKVISGGKIVDKEIMKKIIIPANRICSIEIDPVQVDP